MLKHLFCIFSLLTLALSADPLIAQTDKPKGDTMRALASTYSAFASLDPSAPSAGDPPSRQVSVTFIPEFHYSSHGNLQSVIGGTALKSEGGHSSVLSFTFMATKPLTDWFKLSFMYQYGYSEYDGGLLVPDIAGFGGTSQIEVDAHLVGFIGDFSFKTAGNFQVSLMEVWDIYRGQETMIFPGGATETRSVNSFDDRVFSFLTWWDKPFAIGESWNIDPYVGWRSVKVDLMDMNDWANGGLYDSSSWTHLVAGGVKFIYNGDLWSFNTRVGVHHRINKDDIPGYTSRAVAPGAVNLGFMTSWDRTVLSYGIGMVKVFPEVCVIALGYNGALGNDTNFHTFSFVLDFPF
jgi:hypothetical protein